jgi:hypothetical protein
MGTLYMLTPEQSLHIYLIITPQSFPDVLDWLIDNTYFMFAGDAFKQNK